MQKRGCTGHTHSCFTDGQDANVLYFEVAETKAGSSMSNLSAAKDADVVCLYDSSAKVEGEHQCNALSRDTRKMYTSMRHHVTLTDQLGSPS